MSLSEPYLNIALFKVLWFGGGQEKTKEEWQNDVSCFLNPRVHSVGQNLHWVISYEPLQINLI